MLLHSPDSLVQSRNLCFPLRIVIAKDSKMTLDGFRSLYKSFNNGSVSQAMECQEFKITFTGDMKMQWAALNKRGASEGGGDECDTVAEADFVEPLYKGFVECSVEFDGSH
jgi:hypothetical protein